MAFASDNICTPCTGGPITQALAALKNDGALKTSDLKLVDGAEPRIRDLRLADALGFVRGADIRKLIRRHLGTLRSFGEVCAIWRKPSAQGGRPGTDYWLNKRQALFITAKSDTERAALVTVEMVEVFDAHLAGATLSADAPIMPAIGRGLAVFHLGNRTVLVDTARYHLNDEPALVLRHDGKLAIEHATYDFAQASPWLGRRLGYGRRKKEKHGATSVWAKTGLWIIGAVVGPARPLRSC